MILGRVVAHASVLVALLGVFACTTSTEPRALPGGRHESGGAHSQVPTWSRDDMEFFLHGSMSTEVVPERVLKAFVQIYPDLFPRPDLSHLGLIPDPAFGWPVGFSRRQVPHLGGMSAVGVNCAACHVGEIEPMTGGAPARVLSTSRRSE